MLSTCKLSPTQKPKNSGKPLNCGVLKNYFLQGCKKETDLRVGVEWEKLGVYRETGKAISYSGPKGVRAIFLELIKRHGWRPVFAESHLIALQKNRTSITLEPGGQIELSGEKAATLDQNASELCSHLAEVKEVSHPMGIVWLGLGAQPFSSMDEIEWVPKPRYAIMKEPMGNSGALSHSMMKETASVQISLDYTNEKDAVEKLRLAMGLAPFLTVLFANSPVAGGKISPFFSRRAHIWQNTAPERSGILWKVFEPDFGLDDYLDYALKVPMLFITRENRWLGVRGLTFEDFLKKGWGPHRVEMRDWELHLTSLFTEARLKQYLEIRSVDCQKTELGLSVVALLKGIFYDAFSRKKAWELIAELSIAERKKLFQEAPTKTLKSSFGKTSFLEINQELLRLGGEGLKRLAKTSLGQTDEIKYLKPLEELLKKGKSPAEILIDRLGRNVDVQKVIRYTAI